MEGVLNVMCHVLQVAIVCYMLYMEAILLHNLLHCGVRVQPVVEGRFWTCEVKLYIRVKILNL